MKLPVSMEPSPSPAAHRRAQPGPLRVLVVAGEGSGGLLQSLRQWAPDLGVDVEAAPDLPRAVQVRGGLRSEEHTSELQSPCNLVCRLLLEKKKKKKKTTPQQQLTREQMPGSNRR